MCCPGKLQSIMMLTGPLTAILSSVISNPSHSTICFYESSLESFVYISPTPFFWNARFLFHRWKERDILKKEVTKGIRNKLCFCGSFVQALLGDNESICEGFMEGNKRVQYFIILTQTSLLSSGAGGRLGATWPFWYFSHNELYSFHPGNHITLKYPNQFTNKISLC